MEGAVKRCYFSFTVFHNKVKRNAATLHKETGIVLHDLAADARIDVANSLADIAFEHGIEMLSCCGDYLVGGKIRKANCTDAGLLHRLFPERTRRLVEAPTRECCGCCECTDIGMYDTCAHGCVYCYANSMARTALRSYEQHDPLSDMLGRDRNWKGREAVFAGKHSEDSLAPTLDL